MRSSDAPDPFDVTDTDADGDLACAAEVEMEEESEGRRMPEIPMPVLAPKVEEAEVARQREEAEGRVEARAELGREVEALETLDWEELRERLPGSFGAVGGLTVRVVSASNMIK